MKILAIESSCDESSVSILQDGNILSLCTETQTVHAAYGGVVPELAGRSHLELLVPLCKCALSTSQLALRDIDVFAATRGPGLIGSLLIGINFARGLAMSAHKPFRGMHHIEAHLWSAEMDRDPLPLPLLAFIASGGHTLLVLVSGPRQYEVLGSTLYDAMGEAFDKVGKLGGLAFPAGAALDRSAAAGDARKYSFTIPLQDNSSDFSFSGLKTAFLLARRELGEQATAQTLNDLFASFQFAAVESAARKIQRAIKDLSPRALVCAGGVAANSYLRRRCEEISQAHALPFFVPSLKYCSDNAAMIGYLAHKLELANIIDDSDAVMPRWPIDDLPLPLSA